jgi:hypothetical protein
VEIEYTITENDYVSAAKLAGVATKKQLIWLSLLGLLLLLFALFGENSLRFMGIFGISFGIIGYFLTLYVISPLIAKRHYRRYKLLHQPLRFTVTDSGYMVKNDSGEITVKWSDLLRWRENNEFILLYFAPKLFHMVPKKLAENDLTTSEIEHELSKQLGSAT